MEWLREREKEKRRADLGTVHSSQETGRMIDMMNITEQEQKNVFVVLDDLARAIQADDADNDEPEWDELASEIETALNKYIKNVKTVSINGVNLFGVRRVVVDAYEFRNEDDKADCSVGLLFYGRDCSQEMALIVVDAAKVNLRLSVSDGLDLVSIETVDKLGRRF